MLGSDRSRSPALPWGRRQNTSEEAQQASLQLPDAELDTESVLADEGPHTIEELTRFTALHEGARVQVKWSLDTEEGSATKWWGAVVNEISRNVGGRAERDGKLRYDAFAQFEEEVADVKIGPTRLSQHGVEDPLRWRMEIEGDDEGSDSKDENMADGEVSLEELNRHVSTEEQLEGRPIEQRAIEELQQHLQPDQLRSVISGFTQFTDHIRAQLQQRAAAAGNESYTVTADDIQDILHPFRS